MSHFFLFWSWLIWVIKTMFLDSQIAKSFRLWETKCSCYLVFGLAPYFKETLSESIRSSLLYSVSFDASVNHHIQEEQMDVQVRCWDPETVQAITQYFDSRFFCRPNARKIQEELHEGLSPLDEKAMIMLCIDGPSKNVWFWVKLKIIGTRTSYPRLWTLDNVAFLLTMMLWRLGSKLLVRNWKKFWRPYGNNSVTSLPGGISRWS